MQGELPLAVRVQTLRDFADARLLLLRRVRKREGLETAGFVVTRIISDTETTAGRQRPCHMDAAGEHAEHIGVVVRDADKHVVGQHSGIQKLEEAVLGGLDRGDVARQAFQCGAESLARFAVYPPVDAVVVALVRFTFGLHALMHPLIDLGEAAAHFGFRETEQVDDHHVARTRRQILAVAVFADVAFDAGHAALCHQYMT